MTDDRDESLEKRRERLGAELATKRTEAGEDEAAQASAEESRKGYAQAMKLSSEFISAIVVGALLGYLFDRFVGPFVGGTTPWGLVVLLLLGFCAGVLNVLRSAGMVSTPQPGDRRDEKK